ncbi:MAG: DUF1080 domain-containing protein [Gemmatimonadaceae bacterium]
MLFSRTALAVSLVLIASTTALSAQAATWPQHSLERPKPPVEVAPPQRLPVAPPPGAIVLFNGGDLSWWKSGDGDAAKWRVVDGAFEVVPGTGDLRTRVGFGDVRLHLEWMSPAPPKGEGQDRGNSGVYLQATYEVQVLDSYRNDVYADGQAAAIYGQFPPRVNVTRPPGEWQSYDIEFRRPRFDSTGTSLSPARLTVWHNGVLVHDDVALLGPTSHKVRDPYKAHADELPIMLQDHGHPVRFRNVWVQVLPR